MHFNLFYMLRLQIRYLGNFCEIAATIHVYASILNIKGTSFVVTLY